MTKQYLPITRVPYGAESTPVDAREYRMCGSGPVGTLEEWRQFAKEAHYDGVYVKELNGIIRAGL